MSYCLMVGESYVDKAYYLGYMTNQLLKLYLGLVPKQTKIILCIRE